MHLNTNICKSLVHDIPHIPHYLLHDTRAYYILDSIMQIAYNVMISVPAVYLIFAHCTTYRALVEAIYYSLGVNSPVEHNTAP